jgi:hypothetical protein
VRRRRLPPPDHLTDTMYRALVAMRRRLTARLVLTVSGIALGGLIVGMGVVSAVELVAGRPLSAVATGLPESGTTVGHLVTQAQSATPAPPARRPVAEPSSEPGQVASPSPRETGPSALPERRPATSPVPGPETSPVPGPATSPVPVPAASPVPVLAASPEVPAPAASPEVPAPAASPGVAVSPQAERPAPGSPPSPDQPPAPIPSSTPVLAPTPIPTLSVASEV